MLSLCFRAARARYFTVSLLPVLLSATAVHRPWASGTWPALFLVVLGAFLVHAGSNLWNDLADELNGADRANSAPSAFNGGSRVIQRGEATCGSMRTAAVLCYAGAMLVAFLLKPRGGWGVPVLTLAGILLGICYSSRPTWFCAHGLGELVVAIAFGPLLAEGAYLALAGGLSWAVFLASLPLGLLVAAILLVNSIPDIPPDAQVGKRTMAVRLGKSQAVMVYRAIIGAAFAALLAALATGAVPGRAALALLTLPLAAWISWRCGDPRQAFCIPVAVGTILLHATLGASIVIGFLS
ncbi:MAG: prenyltransferase [Bacteroidota bacterium]